VNVRSVLANIGNGPVGEVVIPRSPQVALPPWTPTPADLAAIAQHRIPKRYRWARWDAPELAVRVAGGQRKVDGAREILSRTGQRGRVVLCGPPGRGKSVLACAWLAERILAGAHRGAFVPDRELLEMRQRDGQATAWFDVALGAHPLVLDNFGTLYGAPAGSGLAGQRIAAVSRLMFTRYDRDMGHVVTTDKNREAVRSIYGDDIARRIFEGAAVVEWT
jgi:DNA replication protein DnaC